MKRIGCFLTIAAVGLSSALAGDLHIFTSADGSKSFKGALLGFNEAAQAVKVRHERGKIMTFKLSVLAEKDQEFVKGKAPMLAAAEGLRIDTDMNRKGLGKNPAGTWICEKIECGYDVAIENSLPNNLGEVDFEYSIFVERDRRDADKTNEVITGSHAVTSFIGHGSEAFTTTTVTLENWSDNPPIPSGGGGG